MKIQCKYETWKKNAFRKNKKLKWNKNNKNALTVLIPLSSIKIIKIISSCNSDITLGASSMLVADVGDAFRWRQVVTDNCEKFKTDLRCLWQIPSYFRNLIDRCHCNLYAVDCWFDELAWLLLQPIAVLRMLIDWTRGMNIDPVKYVKETLSRVGYACEMKFDPFARH